MVDPTMHKKQPILPNKLSRSLRNLDAKTAVKITDSAPKGVTKLADANIYAVKFSTSPSPTKNKNDYSLFVDKITKINKIIE
jgi:hypothetical protein